MLTFRLLQSIQVHLGPSGARGWHAGAGTRPRWWSASEMSFQMRLGNRCPNRGIGWGGFKVIILDIDPVVRKANFSNYRNGDG